MDGDLQNIEYASLESTSSPKRGLFSSPLQ
ncbi:hypothetical protein LINPERPRIM_LOCUS29455 [Linum perenne]